MEAQERIEINRAAEHAWIGFWQSCLREAGGTSRLSFDGGLVGRALNGHPPPTMVVPLMGDTPPDLAGAPPVEHKGKSDWAKQLEGDERVSAITLSDVLLGLEDYFKVFRQMKKVNPDAYEYFSRVGAPLCFENTAIWKENITPDAIGRPVVNPADLPAYFGIFMTRTRERARTDMIEDKPSFLDFQLYEKRRRNIAVVSPWKWTIYDHQEFHLDRDIWTKEERRKFPAIGNWAFHYYIGVGKTGEVQALPMHMSRWQSLRSGGVIPHSQFHVPPGLTEMAGAKLTVDQFVAVWFATIRAFAASALSGVQLSVRRGNEVARFGIPLGYVRSFFRDRDREGARRRPLMHLVGEYQYQRGDRGIVVGEHLRGARQFTWRDYHLTISAPGIHHAAPEAMRAEVLTDEDILPLPKGVITIGEAAQFMQHEMEAAPHVPFRRGVPTKQYRPVHLDIRNPPQIVDASALDGA